MISSAFWLGKRVFVTGHTGFKGSWLALMLARLNARATGYALAPPTPPSLFELASVGELIDDMRGDVRDLDRLRDADGDPRRRRSSFTWRRSRWCARPTPIRSTPTRPMSWAR